MKTKWMSLALVILSSNSWAQAGALFNAELNENTSVTNPAKVLKATEGQWLAFSLPSQAGTRSPCCWKGKWNGMGESGCSLESTHQSYGTSTDSPLADMVIVLGEIRKGQVHELRVVGETCPVNANGARVTWIGDVSVTGGLDWLENTARSAHGESVGGSALFAMALHRNPVAGQRLYSLAKEVDGDLSEEAMFWLAQSDNDSSVAALTELLTR